MPFTNETKRLLLSGLLLLLVNGAAMACAVFAFVEGGFADNALAAAFPALLAFVLTFWQPWLYFLCLIPGGPVVAAFFSIPATLAIYRTGPGQRFIVRLRGIGLGLGARRLAAFVAVFLLVGASVTFSAYRDFPVQHRGIPSQVRDPDSQLARSGVTNSRYYYLSKFLNTSFLWRAQVPRAQVNGLLTELQLMHVPTGTLSERFWSQPPYWWRRPSGAMEEYQTIGFTAENIGEDGWHAGAVYDPQTQTLFLLGQDNF